MCRWALEEALELWPSWLLCISQDKPEDLARALENNLKIGPSADKKFEKPRADIKLKKWDIKVLEPPSPSPRGEPQGWYHQLARWSYFKYAFSNRPDICLHFFQADCAPRPFENKRLPLDHCHLIYCSIVSAFVCILPVQQENWS